MNNFLKYFTTAFYKPSFALELLLKDKNSFKLSFVYILMPILGYTIMYIFLTIGNGAPSVLTPWLNISKESYYTINRFLLTPSMIMCWLLAAAVMQLFSKLFNGNGTFEQTLSVLALSIAVGMTFSLLHDIPMSFLSAVRVIDAKQHEIDMNSPTIWRTLLWVFYAAYFIAFFILFPACVRMVHKLSRSKSIFIGITSFIIFQIVFLIFNR